MAGDWIKMRGNLWDDPRVSAIVDATDSSEAAVVGALYWLWATADQHTDDGILPGLNLRQIDRKTGVKGFAEAIVTIGWIEECADGIRIVRFDEHNGASAKKRCQTAKRVANFKANGKEVTQESETGNAVSVTGALPRDREEKEIDQEQKQKKGRASAPACPEDVEPQVWADWLALRKAKRAPASETVIREARKEAAKAGMSFSAFLAVWCRRGSQGLEADWLKPNERQPQGPPATAPGKQVQGLMALEAMKRERMAGSGNLVGPAKTGLLVTGSDAGCGNVAGDGSGVD